MTTRGAARRGGFTLIEMLVVIGLIIALAAIVVAVGPGALEKDRAVAAVNQLQGALQIARSKAVRDGLPRGVRLLANGTLAAEYQYIEAPPVYVPNPAGPGADIHVDFNYSVDGSGRVNGRTCTVSGSALTSDQANQISADSSLQLPTLGTAHRITGATVAGAAPNLSVTLVLATYPDDRLGAATRLRTYHFGLYAPARPLLGEPNFLLPQRSAVDLGPGRSVLPTTAGNYDILFGPGGGVVTPGGAGHVFLWVRDPTRPDNLQQGGEQMLVVVKGQTGALGAAPISFGTDPYEFGRKAVSGN
jgi:type II secretory pathway pseudopilin PulG